MIDETSAFLTWALEHDEQLPQIPRQEMSKGGYDKVLKRRGARAAVNHWWHKAVEIVGKVSER